MIITVNTKSAANKPAALTEESRDFKNYCMQKLQQLTKREPEALP